MSDHRIVHLARLASIEALYLVLVLYNIDGQSLWSDEVISITRVNTAGGDLIFSPHVWRSQSPLYFLSLGLWATVSSSTFALRSLSVIFGAVSIGYIYALALRLFNLRVATISALLYSTSPFLVWYSQEVRYITLTLLTSLLAMYLFHRVSNDRARLWLSYGTASLLTLFSFISAMFLLPAKVLYLAGIPSCRPALKKWIACHTLVLLLFSLWFGVVFERKISGIFGRAPAIVVHEKRRAPDKISKADLLGAIPYTLFAFSVGFSFGPPQRELHTNRSLASLIDYAPTLVPAGILFATLFVFGLVRLRQDGRSGMLVLLWLCVPIIGVFGTTMMTTFHVYNVRYVAMALPAYILILARGIAGLRPSGIQLPVIAAVLCLNAISLFNYYYDSQYSREDARSAARYLERAGTDGVVVVIGQPRALRYYYKGELPVERIDARSRDGDLVIGELRELLNRHKRLWLVKIRSWQTDPREQIKPALDMLARQVEHRNFPGVEIYSYVQRPA